MNHAKSKARNSEVVARAVNGTSIIDLAAEFDITPNYIYTLVRNSGAVLPQRINGRGVKNAPRAMYRRAILAELHSLGIPSGAAARLLNISRVTFYQDAKKCGLKFPYDNSRWLVGGRNSQHRAAKMAAMYRAGMTLEQIGKKHGISRERVRQLMAKHEGVTHKDGGQRVMATANRQRSTALRDARYLASHGCSFAQYAEVRQIGREMVASGKGIYSTPLRAFLQQKNNAGHREIPWELTFWQWWTIWQESGKWEARGRSKDGYVMSRFGDQGAYAAGNVVIGTLSQNSSVQPNNPYRKDHPDHDSMVKKSRIVRTCSIEGCTKRHFARSYCNAHYYHFVTKIQASGQVAA